jgi:2-polyprenyl-3-methyl-5-hydroxy-6-metoxy-1,4-benzoquinol methylase
VSSHRGHSLRYDVEQRLLSPSLRERFVELGLDDDARAFIDRAIEQPHGRIAKATHRTLTHVLSDFEVNGLLGTHPLFLCSTEQWRRLLGPGEGRRLLDVGSGSGDVTATLAPLFRAIQTTEASWAMARRLLRRGFPCSRLDVSSEPIPEAPFDVITCLNVIDRSDRPRTLLARLASALTPGGRLVVATPLPISQLVYDRGRSRAPRERLLSRAARFEHAVTEIAQNELGPLGLSVLSLSRAPYLSRGFRERPLWILDDAIFVCARS